MTREIKFRAWVRGGYYIEFDLVQALKMNTSDGMLNDVLVAEMEQFTGLKDKTGRDVYAGDIVQIEYFKKVHTGVIDEDGHIDGKGFYDVCGECSGDIAHFSDDEIKVIGNIHEKKEVE